MNLKQSILEAVRTLTPEKQREILTHAEKLSSESAPLKPRWSGKGLWADLNVALSAEGIEENQREMWKNFPREDILP